LLFSGEFREILVLENFLPYGTGVCRIFAIEASKAQCKHVYITLPQSLLKTNHIFLVL